MNDFIPNFDARAVFVSPWTDTFATYGWIMLMGFLVTVACGLIGNYLILRRMALVGDAISHSVLPGIAIAFLVAQSRHSLVMFGGALAAGIVTTLLIETIHRRSRVKQDAAIGIVFSSLFAVGVILISLFASQIDLDADCVLYGEISFVALEPLVTIGGIGIAPESVFVMFLVAAVVATLVILFYKELLVSSFDSGLAASLGINPTIMHYSLMCALSVVVVSAFRSVGAILVIAMLILPGATAFLITYRLPKMMVLSVVHSALSSVLGVHLAIWLDCAVASAIVVAGAGLFLLAWIFSPTQGLIARFRPQLLPIEAART
ncbi:MAG TPA: metal ABC transporter permease [Chthoniobacteraceae bacterium]|jgi:manganese/zinc/iron transport system permease protein|nr:transporter [Chthoniobacter sp.]HEV7866513.1 metal ABC transporter permease [Chthoniobacteraceae bacterium]